MQPHAGSGANLAAYLSRLPPGSRILALNLREGGHLSHGANVSATARIFSFGHYGLIGERIDYNEIERRIAEFRPRMLVIGFSSYPRDVDYVTLREICDRYGVLLHCDVSHTIGLIIGGLMNSPFEYADSVMFTTHKTFRGGRGAVLFGKNIKKAVFPGLQGGPFMNNIASIANAAEEAAQLEFKERCDRIQQSAARYGALFGTDRLFTGGTDCHYFVTRCAAGAEDELERAGIIVSPQVIGKEHGIRVGFPFLVNQEATDEEIGQLVDIMCKVCDGEKGTYFKHQVSEIMRVVADRLTA